MFKKILVASDSVAVCDAATIFASELAKKEDAGLRLLHVLESSDLIRRQWVKDFRSGKEIAATPEYTQAVKQTIADTCATMMAGCREYVIEVKPGFPWSEILKTARNVKADLIVLGPHGSRAQEKGVVRVPAAEGLGSTLEAVIMRAHCPVMIVNHSVPEEKQYFKNVLLCTDFSETCQYASELTVQLARRYGSRVHILHVLRIPRGERMAYTVEQVQGEMARTKEKLERTYGSRAKGIDCPQRESILQEHSAVHGFLRNAPIRVRLDVSSCTPLRFKNSRYARFADTARGKDGLYCRTGAGRDGRNEREIRRNV